MATNASTATSVTTSSTSCPNTLSATDTEALISVGAGTFVGVTGKVQASHNGTDYVDWPSYDVNGASVAAGTTITLTDSTAAFIARVSGLQGMAKVRFLATGFTSGSAPVTVTSGYFGPTSTPSVPASTTGTSLTTGAGGGITAGVGTVFTNSVTLQGTIYRTTILIDLTGLGSSTTDLDIIGVGTNPAYLCKLAAAQCGGTIDAISVTCLEAPAGGVTDIDLYSATEATGKFDDAVTGLTETALITAGGAWTNGATKGATVCPAANEYLYLTGGAAGTAATYTAGKFLITIFGH